MRSNYVDTQKKHRFESRLFPRIFSSEPVNTDRQFEVDIAKAVVACTLPAIHVFVECSPDEALDSFGVAYLFDSILGGPMAAPMFMFCMGIGLLYSRRTTPAHVFRRGVMLLGLGAFLNICRYVLPCLIGFAITGDAEFYVDRLPYLFFTVDIWQFAGLAHIFMALLLWLEATPLATMLVGVLLSLIATFIGDVETGYDVIDIIISFFVGVGAEGRIYSDFPLFIWFLIYSFGYVFGYYLIRIKDIDRFYRRVTLPCLLIPVGVMVWEYNAGFGMMGGSGANVFYHMSAPESLICGLFTVGEMGVYHFIKSHLPVRSAMNIEKISRSLMAIYFAQWVLVWWTIDLLVYVIRGSQYLDWGPALLIGAVLGIAAANFGVFWTSGKRRDPNSLYIVKLIRRSNNRDL